MYQNNLTQGVEYEKSLRKIKEIKKVYELDLDASHSHKLTEKTTRQMD